MTPMRRVLAEIWLPNHAWVEWVVEVRENYFALSFMVGRAPVSSELCTYIGTLKAKYRASSTRSRRDGSHKPCNFNVFLELIDHRSMERLLPVSI